MFFEIVSCSHRQINLVAESQFGKRAACNSASSSHDVVEISCQATQTHLKIHLVLAECLLAICQTVARTLSQALDGAISTSGLGLLSRPKSGDGASPALCGDKRGLGMGIARSLLSAPGGFLSAGLSSDLKPGQRCLLATAMSLG
ncbi:hypothetical protein V2G26_012079 [Clonostachys chloroleuca]